MSQGGVMSRRSLPDSTDQDSRSEIFLLAWLVTVGTFVLSELSDTQKVRGILWRNKVPHSWILSKIISFQARNWDRRWLINLAQITIWTLWWGGSLLLSFFVNQWLGVIWFIIPAIYGFFVLRDLIKFTRRKTPKTNE